MIKLGYNLSSEEQEPMESVAQAQMTEDSGFHFLLIPDHFHPWVPQQGQSPFVWSTLGGIAQATERVSVGTDEYLNEHIYQVGPEQEGFLQFFKSQLLPLLEKETLVTESV